ncbi:MAG: TonB-dependent receptor [Bryobacteraceae bacterium]
MFQFPGVRRPYIFAACFLLVGLQTTFAQGQFGSILGTITDASGGAIPGAKVAAVNSGKGLRIETTSNQLGLYQLLQLNPGSYTVQAEANGFKKIERAGVQVQVADRITLDLPMEVGSLNEVVNVTAEALALRTSDAQTGEVVNNTMVENLPQLNRDPLALVVLAGNVQGGGSRAQPGSDTRINGGRTIGVEYNVDGITAGTGLGHKVVDTTPTMEAVAEFKVITNGISAEYGRLSGGVVEVVTKGGTNDLHGQLFEYFQNDHLNANSWQQNALGGSKVKFSQNLFGGVVGGPVVLPKIYNGKNKTFFFFNYEGFRLRQAGALQVASVPTELERKGDFSQTFYNGISPILYDQNGPVVFDSAKNQYTRQQLVGDGKHIPVGMLSPVSLAILKYVPLPNHSPTPGTSSAGNYIAPQSQTGNRDLWALRIDQNFGNNQRFFGRFTHRDSDSGFSRWRGPASTANQNSSQGAIGVALNYDWTISPTLLVNARAGVNHSPNTAGNLLPPDLNTSDVPFDPVTREVLGTGNFPLVRGTGTYADSASRNISNYTTYDNALTLTKIMGRHALKVGFQNTRYYDNYSTSGSGVFSFEAAPVHQIAGVDFGFGSDISAAYAGAAFMLGINDQATVSGGTTRANNFNYYAGFVQDDFKVSRKLTLNLGVRWDLESPLTERHDKLYFWDPTAPPPFSINPGYNFAALVTATGLNPAQVRTPAWVTNGFAPGAIRIANTPEFPSRTGTYYHWNHFAPRFGAAYQISPKTVMRGSFGMTYIPSTGAEQAYSGSGLKLADGADAGWHASNDNLVHLISTFANPFTPGEFTRYSRTNQAANFDAGSPTSPAGFSRDSTMPYEMTASFGFQHELPKQLVLEAVYNANLGRSLIGSDEVGQFPKDLFNGGQAGQNSRIYTTQIASPTAGQTQNNSVVGDLQNLGILQAKYPYFGPVTIKGSNIGRSNYNAVNVRLERRFGGDLYMLANYTYSKLLDNVGGTNVGDALGSAGGELGSKHNQTVDNTTDVYGVSTLDETHVLRFAFNYQLPVGRSKKFLSSPQGWAMKLVDGAVGGWELAGLGSVRSGRPVVLSATTPNINNNVRAEWTYGNFIDPNNPTVSNPAFAGNSSVFFSTRDTLPANTQGRFFNARDASVFTYGTLPPIFSTLREPSAYSYDMSLMKAFPLAPDGKRYLQFRMEGRNMLNIRGYGPYNTTIGTKYFGLITSAGQVPRAIEMSARIIF